MSFGDFVPRNWLSFFNVWVFCLACSPQFVVLQMFLFSNAFYMSCSPLSWQNTFDAYSLLMKIDNLFHIIFTIQTRRVVGVTFSKGYLNFTLNIVHRLYD